MLTTQNLLSRGNADAFPEISKRFWKSASIPCLYESKDKRNSGGPNVKTVGKIKTTKSFAGLQQLLSQDQEGFEQYVAPNLEFGDVWWIPDEVSGFGNKDQHPWVIVKGYSSYRANVIACPRTSSIQRSNQGVVTPAGLLSGLDRVGLFLLKHRHPFVAQDFRDFIHIGRLPQDWINKLQSFYRRR